MHTLREPFGARLKVGRGSGIERGALRQLLVTAQQGW
jgi:hypothetical protein